MTLRLVSADVAPVWRGSTGSARDDRVTEALAGEPVRVTGREEGGRVEVVACWQPSSLHADGYPGWVDRGHLGPAVEAEPPLAVPAGALEGAPEDPVELARRLLGAPYVWGGLSHAGIDCSGLVHHVGIVIEPGILLHASDSNGGVVEGHLDAGRQETLVSAGRPPVDLR
jgi:cell wall-associated NlpC family hydrolase